MAKRKTFRPGKRAVRRVLLTGAVFVVGFVLLSILAIQGWEYSNSVEFCTNVCHGVHAEEPTAYQDSYHARVQCTECHLGRVGMIRGIVLKTSHLRHLPEAVLGQYGRPLESETLRPADESCERCHWAPAYQGDQVLDIRHFRPDEDNTEKRTYLILKIGGGKLDELAGGMGYGIHWHALNKVEYIATDEEGQVIRWVRATLPDGRTVEYHDVTNPLSPEEIARAEKQVMDCVDCHNRMGHPFPSPEDLADEALADGRLSRDLPFVKKEMLTLLTASYPSQEEALAAVESWQARYEAAYPEVAATQAAAIEQAAQVARELLPRLVFEKEGVTWQSFADNNGHDEFPGCFRCHDGKHLSPEGESIRLHCNICHAVPVTVDPGGGPPEMPAATLQEPESHLETNFMADHRFQANGGCVECHGEVAFGRDDSSFCANSACHGRAWPVVDLDATFTHTIQLEGQHAEVWCHDCHDGVKKPDYECANCHEASAPPHFGETCEDCHTTAGFEQVNLEDFRHPTPLEGEHAALDCVACHAAGQALTDECAACHQPPGEHPAGSCDACHTAEGWVESAASIVAEAPTILHILDSQADCLLCHEPGGPVRPAPVDHERRTGEQCNLCHKGLATIEELEAGGVRVVEECSRCHQGAP